MMSSCALGGDSCCPAVIYCIAGKFGGQKIWRIVLKVKKIKIWRIPTDSRKFYVTRAFLHVTITIWRFLIWRFFQFLANSPN